MALRMQRFDAGGPRMRTVRVTLTMMCIVLATACASGPKSVSGQHDLEVKAQQTVRDMTAADPSLKGVLSGAPAYAVFPNVGKGGFVVSGGYGDGILYVHGQPAGVVSIKQAGVGLTAGGQAFSELLVLNDPAQINKIKSGKYEVGAEVSAVALTAGAAASANLSSPTTVFVHTKGGLMVDVSVAGQRIDFQPLA
jgi:lipid-binding SYLF domain-containing protein